MEDFSEKLNKFASIVLQDANEERDKLIEETEDKYQTIIAEKESEYLEEAYKLIQKCKTEAKKASGEELMQIEMDSRKKLLLKREEIINNVMTEVRERLSEFKHSPEYGDWLVRKAKAALFEAGEGNKTIYISGDDMKYKPSLESIGEAAVEGTADHGLMGGIRVYNHDKNISVDYSLKELFAAEKLLFLQNSGLSIR